jgi:hypothetical protein
VLKEKESLHEFLSISKAEESFFKQKSRNQWLNLGDQNTSYFHRMVKVRTSRNSIHMLMDSNGHQVREIEQIKDVAVNFYKHLLGSDSLIFDSLKAERVSQLVTPILSSDQCARLQAVVTEEEIKATLFAMKSNKAPGPDGFLLISLRVLGQWWGRILLMLSKISFLLVSFSNQ